MNFLHKYFFLKPAENLFPSIEMLGLKELANVRYKCIGKPTTYIFNTLKSNQHFFFLTIVIAVST